MAYASHGGKIAASSFTCLVAIAASMLFPSAKASAQSQGDTPAQDRENPRAAAGAPVVTVTARKTEESIQDIPIAISALSSEELEQSRVYDIRNLAELVTGVSIAGSAQRGYPVIRGITTRTPDAGADGTVGQYIDQVYQPRIANQLTGLLDLERVEVLKGPQGTLFGRNTIAGAINYVSRRPADTLYAKGTVGVGNRGMYEARASISGPLADTLSAGVSGLYRTDNGNFDVVNEAGDVIGNDGNEDYGGRISLVWEPTDNLEIYASAMYIRLQGANIDQVDGNPAGNIAPQLADFYAPSDFIGDSYNYQVALTDPGFVNRASSQYTLRADWDVADNITLTSLTSYQTFDMTSEIDLDLEVQAISVDRLSQNSNTFSQEIRLASDGEVFRWNIGANFFRDQHYFYEDIDISAIAPIPLITSLDVETTSWALFGQAYYSPIENLNFSLGLRYSNDHREYRKTQTFEPFAVDFDSALDPTWDTTPTWDALSYNMAIDYHLRDGFMVYASHSRGYRSGGVQGRAQTPAEARINYGPETAYQYEVGFKSEFFDRRFFLDVAAYYIDYRDIQINQISYDGPFASDIIQNAGRARMQGIEVDMKAFVTSEISIDFGYSYNDSKFVDYQSSADIQTSIDSLVFPDGSGVCPVFPTFYGCAANDYIYDDVPFEFASKHTFIAALNFDHQFADHSGLHFRAEYSWRNRYLLTLTPRSIYDLPTAVKEANFVEQGAVGLLNANLTYDLPGGDWSISLWGRNLTGERYGVLGTDPAVVNDPGAFNNFKYGDRRTYGLSASFSF